MIDARSTAGTFMRRGRAIVLSLSFGFGFGFGFGAVGVAFAQPSATIYLQSARELGEWLIAITDQGRRWPTVQTLDGAFGPPALVGLDKGPAGIGLFFVTLHRHTGDPAHLSMAVAAAEYERAQHLGGFYNGHDYLAGAAGSGLFLLALYGNTGDPRYLDWAEDIARWHDETSLRPAPGERYWVHGAGITRVYTGIPHGAAGVAMFHLALFHHTDGVALYRDMAEDAYRWIRNNHAFDIGADGLGFRRLTTDTAIYNWWSGGSAGMVQLQGMLYASTGDERYLDDLERTADGLLAVAQPAAPNGLYWTLNGTPDSYRPAVFSHGNASVVQALMIAHEYLPDARYLDAARAGIGWLESIARASDAAGIVWPHGVGSTVPPVTSAMLGTGSIAWTLARLSALSGQSRVRELALAGADYLVAIGDVPEPGQRRWRNYLGAEAPSWGPRLYDAGWYDGNAGIGLALVAAHELATGQRPGLDVHMP